MVVQVLANLSPAMIPDYAQAPVVYVETDGSRCLVLWILSHVQVCLPTSGHHSLDLSVSWRANA